MRWMDYGRVLQPVRVKEEEIIGETWGDGDGKGETPEKRVSRGARGVWGWDENNNRDGGDGDFAPLARETWELLLRERTNIQQEAAKEKISSGQVTWKDDSAQC